MVAIRTDFDSGNIGTWSWEDTRCLRFEAPTDGARWAMWFYFRMENASPGWTEFVVTNGSELLEFSHWGDVRPLIREYPAGAWQRAPDNAVSLDLAAGEFRFRFKLPEQPVEIAYGYPYTPSIAEELFQALQGSSGIEISYPGTSAQGRPIPYVIMRCTDPTAQPQVIWAQSREHAAEVSGAYTLDGFLRAAAASPLRSHYEIHALPIVDLDAVVEGRYGKTAPPVDHHVAWAGDTPRPEVALAMRLMRATADQGKPVRLFLNFHSPSPENDNYLPPLNPTLLSPTQRLNFERLYNAIATCSPTQFSFSVDEQSFERVSPWYGDDVEHRADVFVLREFGADSCLVETAYHASPDGTPATPEWFRHLGASVALGVEKYLLSDSQGRIGFYEGLGAAYQSNHGWLLWRVPRFTRLQFRETWARATGDDPSAYAYIGMPRLFSLNELSTVTVHRRPGGNVHVQWQCYDDRQTRLLATIPPSPISESASPQALALPSLIPAATRWVRPSFVLEGAFRTFEVAFQE